MYVKLFSSLYQGTLRGRSDEILVFTNLLAHADMHGNVDKHFKAISEETGLPRERVEAAIATLEAPDPESRSPEMQGCRLVRMDDHRIWGWKIVNYGKYRAIRNEEDRREQNRAAQERFRSKHSKPHKPEKAQGEAEGEAKALKEPSAPSALDVRFQAFWNAYPRKVGKGAAERLWKRLAPDAALLATILAAIEAQLTCAQWTKDGGEFIPHPATWLNRKGWLDEAVKINYGTCKFCPNPATAISKRGIPHCATPRHIDQAEGKA